MSLFGKETGRIVRKTWQPHEIDDLAQEIYALLNGNLPITTNAPVTINTTDGQTGLTINQGDDPQAPAVAINNGGVQQTIGGNTTGDTTIGGITFNPPADGSPPSAGGDGSGGGGGGGPDLSQLDYPSGTPDPAAVPPPSQTPFVLYGEVVSQLAGNQYAVDVWARDPDSAPRLARLAVSFKGVDPADTIAPGTPCPVLCFPGATVHNSLGIVQALGFVATFMPV